jgi:SAM-dependent methyltransferase
MEADQHNLEIHENRRAWENKPVLREVYADLYHLIAANLAPAIGDSQNLELGSGMGNVKQFIPDCITSDIFRNPWLDRMENAYQLNFPEESLANLILFDVWHHLEYPANALAEAARVLKPGGRLLVMDPAMSATGRFVYGLFHHEPLGFRVGFQPKSVDLGNPADLPYFAAQSSAQRLFVRRESPELLLGWNILNVVQITSFAYLASGGFRGRQLYPDRMLPVVRAMDRLLGVFPRIFAARLLVVLEKSSS